MKKLVNGKIVDIKNIELFEKAAEGVVLGKLAASAISDKITVESSIINNCITHYEIFYKSMPFPLYALESNLKYAVLATFIKDCIEETLHMWVDDALFISIDKEHSTALKLVSNTWGIVKVACEKEDNTSIENFKEQAGYKEYNWLLRKIMMREGTGSFYTEFMPEFVKACNNQSMIMQWELSNILTFGNLPEKLSFKENRIVNLDNKAEFLLDIYTAGNKKTGEGEYTMSLLGNDNDLKLKPKYVKTYGFEAYEKPYSNGEDNTRGVDKLKKNSVVGLTNVFNTLCSIKMATERSEFEQFRGFIADRDLVYTINNRLFICKAYRAGETKEIARGIELCSYDRGLIYFIRTTNMGKGIKKEMIYSYSLRDENLRLCKIQFVV